MRLEQRIMIGAEMSRGAPTMHGGVAHAAEVGTIDRTAVHADADEAALLHESERARTDPDPQFLHRPMGGWGAVSGTAAGADPAHGWRWFP